MNVYEIPSIFRRLAAPVTAYFMLATLLHNQLLITSTSVVDELFHIPQGLAYCTHEFKQWDPKITTLPGLYIFSTILCGTTNSCNTACLRYTNICASIVNIFLFYKIIRQINPQSKKYVHNAMNLAIMPPLFFFSQVYYTDVLSLTMVLALMYHTKKGNSFWASVFGFFSILMRQTNAIYVFMFGGIRIIGLFYSHCFKEHRFAQGDYRFAERDFFDLIKRDDRLDRFISACVSLPLWVVFEISLFINLGVAFLTFIYLNGGIVVGDKGAHAAKLHIPQLYYFALFTVFFAWPYFLNNIVSMGKLIFGNLKAFALWLAFVHVLFALYLFTRTTHPYLLADNRHYMFYAWKLFFSTEIRHYILTPLIAFCILLIFDKLYNKKDLRFIIFYLISAILVLCFQSLVDVRYFIVPFIIFRLQLLATKLELYLETAFYIFINLVTYFIFFTKEIVWAEFTEPQRIIW